MARLGVIADVHGNLVALKATLQALDKRGIDGLICAGDLVGYNAEPDEVVSRLVPSAHCVAGNHDRIAIGRLDDAGAWKGARHALARTRGVLRLETRSALAELPEFRVLPEGIAVFHGAVDEVSRRCSSPDEFRRNWELLSTLPDVPWLACYGHTHSPGVHRIVPKGSGARVVPILQRGRAALVPGEVWFLNPGSVDAARRKRKVAQYAVVDLALRTVELADVPYDHQTSERCATSGGYRLGWFERLVG